MTGVLYVLNVLHDSFHRFSTSMSTYGILMSGALFFYNFTYFSFVLNDEHLLKRCLLFSKLLTMCMVYVALFLVLYIFFHWFLIEVIKFYIKDLEEDKPIFVDNFNPCSDLLHPSIYVVWVSVFASDSLNLIGLFHV